MSARTFFGVVIVVVLLAFYVGLVREAIGLLDCTPQPTCAGGFTASMATALATIGGLVSAVVIAELAVTGNGATLGGHMLEQGAGERRVNVVRWATMLYVLVWLVIGLWAVLATFRAPDVVPELTALARSWFGVAVAAAFAFFGVKPTTHRVKPKGHPVEPTEHPAE